MFHYIWMASWSSVLESKEMEHLSSLPMISLWREGRVEKGERRRRGGRARGSREEGARKREGEMGRVVGKIVCIIVNRREQ